jgi:hypothetical protein
LPDIQEQCRNLWEKVGESYIDKVISNDEKLKEKMNFVLEMGQPKHYPEKGLKYLMLKLNEL